MVLLVAVGAAVGAPARYLTDRVLSTRRPGGLPLGTLTVNVVASFLLGVTVGMAGGLSDGARALIATGFCGALSTFSTFGHETLTLGRDGRSRVALGYVVLSVVAGLGAGALGWVLGAL